VAEQKKKIVITGAAGLVGQNLVTLLAERADLDLVAIDKHAHNLGVLSRLHPQVTAVLADLADPGSWHEHFAGAEAVVQLHAQITGKGAAPFVRNNVDATRLVLDAIRRHGVPYLVHVSSSVVNSVAEDDYTRTKEAQEELVRASGIPHCTLRPTLMFGWFDPKHLGWLARFIERTPVFPIPGHGRYMRQPLYNRDFCRIIAVCLERRPQGTVYDLVGQERVDYVDIIQAIRRAKELRTPIVHIPIWLFAFLLRTYALFSANPPFTADQLTALTAGDDFSGVDIEGTFGIRPTPFAEAIDETFRHPVYSAVKVESYV
jgi:uncharacterized protein YbjT (DUF2867 family)